jgi:hypothetical protein
MVSMAQQARGDFSGDRAFQRDVLKQLLTVPAAREAVFNLTDIEDLIQQTGLPPRRTCKPLAVHPGDRAGRAARQRRGRARPGRATSSAATWRTRLIERDASGLITKITEQ